MARDVSTPPSTLIARRVAIGAASNYVGKFIGLATWFLLTPFILDRLGPAGFGLWALIGSLTSYGYLLDLGIGGAVVKYVAELRARGEWTLAHAFVATALRAYLLLGAAAVGIGLLAAVAAPQLLTIEAADRRETMLAIGLAGLSVGLSIAFSPALSVLRGLQRYDLYNIVSTGGTLLQAAATVAVLLAGMGIVGMVAVSVPATIAMQAVAIALVRRIAPDLRFGWRGARRELFRPIFGFSSAAFAMELSGRLQTRTDEIVIALFLPIRAVTPYSLARRLSEISLVVADQFVKVLMPLASELDALRDEARLRQVYVLATRLTLAIFAPLAMTLVVFAQPVLVAWVGRENAGGAQLVAILATASLFRAIGWPAASVLQGMNRHRPIAVLSIASGLANLALSIVLVQAIGIVGVAFGTLIPTAVEGTIILPYGLRVMGIPVLRGVRSMLLPALGPLVPAAALAVLLDAWLQPSGLDFVVPAAIAGAVYVILYLVMPGTREERALFARLVGMVRATVAPGSR